MHKYGVRVPRNVKEALEIDAENGNTLWDDAIELEMKNNRVAFEEYDDNIGDLVAYEQISGHRCYSKRKGYYTNPLWPSKKEEDH